MAKAILPPEHIANVFLASSDIEVSNDAENVEIAVKVKDDVDSYLLLSTLATMEHYNHFLYMYINYRIEVTHSLKEFLTS